MEMDSNHRVPKGDSALQADAFSLSAIHAKLHTALLHYYVMTSQRQNGGE